MSSMAAQSTDKGIDESEATSAAAYKANPPVSEVSTVTNVSQPQEGVDEENLTPSKVEPDKLAPSISRTICHRNSNVIHDWADVSQINYLSIRPLDVVTSVTNVLRRRSIALPSIEKSLRVLENFQNKEEMDALLEEFPINVTSLLNEDNNWGCFYIFPEFYDDIFSPVVRIRELADVPDLEGGVLTRDMVTACLTYLRRTPILGDFVYIKLDLSSKRLEDIDVLKFYKYLVYLDLSSNYLTNLTVLSNLPYLQYLSVAFNNLTSVLEYEPPQWFLSEVHYKFNSVKNINDLSAFWSITVLNLSHNNIKHITGLENLRYLRRLDLSFNHIQRLENLNNLRLLWLDVSYNNISTFEMSPQTGLWTLLHLEYLNLNDNNLTSMKMFSDCTRLRELHVRNNRFGILLEVAVYMNEMRRLIVLDLRANPICSMPGYKDVVINTFPHLISLDAVELDPVEQRTLKMDMFPDVTAHATRRLLRLLYIQQLSRAHISPFVPPADTTDVPIVVIVGHEAVGKGTLVRRLAAECSANIEIGRQHTTSSHHFSEQFIEVTRQKFDKLLLDGEFLTYSELYGESYGLSREEAYVKDGKVRIVSMDLVGALMLKLRGYRPYLILASIRDKNELQRRQCLRRLQREAYHKKQLSVEAMTEHSTLQVLLSGRFIIRGILNELILELPDEQEKNEFVMESECSLMLDSAVRKGDDYYVKDPKVLALLTASNLSLELTKSTVHEKATQDEPSLYSLFKESQASDYQSYTHGSYQSKRNSLKSSKAKQSSFSQRKSYDFSRYTSSTWKASSETPEQGSKTSTSKSVTFTWQDNANSLDPAGLLIEPQHQKINEEEMYRSISTRGPWVNPGNHAHHVPADDSDLWLAFLTEARQRQASDIHTQSSDLSEGMPQLEELSYMINDLRHNAIPTEPVEYIECIQALATTRLRENYENFHRRTPGVFWDTVMMDNPEKAFKKVRAIIREIVDTQSALRPMFDIDFANLSDYPTVEENLVSIREQIAPQQLFF